MPRQIRASFNPSGPLALEVFTDRTGPVEAFEKLLAENSPTENDVLVFYGEGGVGKSLLLEKLGNILKTHERRHRTARLDFNDVAVARNSDLALFRLSRQFHGVAFTTFDIALAFYGAKFHPEAEYRSASNRAHIIEDAGAFGQVMDTAFQLTSTTPGLNVAVSLFKVVQTGSALIKDWWARSGEKALQGMEQRNEQELRMLLVHLWAQDLHNSLTADAPCPVIFLDTYENLWSNSLARTGLQRHLREGWLRELISLSPRVLWVIAGREKLRWDEHNPSWAECCHQHFLGKLSRVDAADFLTKRRVTDPGVRETILASADGLPFYLELQCQIHDRLAPEEKTPEKFGGAHPDVIQRLLGYLENSEQQTMRLLACFGAWDDNLFQLAVAEFQTGYPPSGAALFHKGSWSVEEVSAGNYQLHHEMVHHLRQGERTEHPQQWKARNKWGFHYFDDAIGKLAVRDVGKQHAILLGRAWLHATEHLPADEVESWFHRRLDVLKEGAIWADLIDITSAHLEWLKREWPADSLRWVPTMQLLAYLLHTLYNYGEAEPIYRAALEILKDQPGEANIRLLQCQQSLARLLKELARFDEAEEIYAQMLHGERASKPGDPNLAAALGHADTLRKRGRAEEAERVYRQMLAEIEQAGGFDAPALVGVLGGLSLLLKDLKRYTEAESVVRRALQLEEEVAGAHSADLVRLLTRLGIILRETGRGEEAIPHYKRALQIQETIWGELHPLLVSQLSSLAATYRALGKLEEAELLCRKALKIEADSMGPRSPSLTYPLNALALTLSDLNRAREAEELFAQALAIKETAHGFEHPDLVYTLREFADFLRRQGCNEQAAAHLHRAIAIQEKHNGPDDAEALKLRYSLQQLDGATQ